MSILSGFPDFLESFPNPCNSILILKKPTDHHKITTSHHHNSGSAATQQNFCQATKPLAPTYWGAFFFSAHNKGHFSGPKCCEMCLKWFAFQYWGQDWWPENDSHCLKQQKLLEEGSPQKATVIHTLPLLCFLLFNAQTSPSSSAWDPLTTCAMGWSSWS